MPERQPYVWNAFGKRTPLFDSWLLCGYFRPSYQTVLADLKLIFTSGTLSLHLLGHYCFLCTYLKLLRLCII